LLCLVRQARGTVRRDPIDAIRAITPTLERLGRIAEQAFEEVEPTRGTGNGNLLHPSVMAGIAILPPRINDGQPASVDERIGVSATL
jgi:hypothetical protein